MCSDISNRHEAKGPWGFWPTLLFGAAILLITFLATIFLATFYTAGPMRGGGSASSLYDGTVITLTTLVSVPIMLGCIALCIHIRKGPTLREYIGFKPVGVGTVLRWTGALLLFLAAAELLSQTMGRPLLPDFVIQTYQTAASPLLLFIAVVIAAPLAEEIFFRGFLLTGFRASPLGEGAAVSLSTVLWAANHFQYGWFEIILVFILGVMMGFAKIKTGSIYTPLALHAAVNLLTFVVTAAYLGADV